MGEHLQKEDHASLGPWVDSLGWGRASIPNSAPGIERNSPEPTTREKQTVPLFTLWPAQPRNCGVPPECKDDGFVQAEAESRGASSRF